MRIRHQARNFTLMSSWASSASRSAASTDGVTFARFDNSSRTADPVDAFGRVDTTEIEGLAGEVDLLDIHFVKFTDVVGDGSVKDSFDRPIYAPYPCTGSAGFDLDAVGVLHPADL